MRETGDREQGVGSGGRTGLGLGAGRQEQPGKLDPWGSPDPGSVRSAVRGTQTFVYTMSWCWRHPSVVGLEVLWRWVFGVGALWLVGTRAMRIFSAATGGTNDLRRLGLDTLTVTDPMGASAKIAGAAVVLLPMVLQVARWMAPLLLAVWVVVSAVGRTAVLRRADPTLRARPLTLMALQVVRVVALGGGVLVWFLLMMWAAATAVTGPLGRGGEPELVKYFALVIVGTLGLFTLWAVVSWTLSIAPLLAMLRGYGVWASLRAGFRLGPLKMKLVEINLVMGIVKVALLVLALVFSASPLPFESVTSQGFLTWWWVAVGIWYCVASDFFHVARQVGYLQLWRAYEPA